MMSRTSERTRGARGGRAAATVAAAQTTQAVSMLPTAQAQAAVRAQAAAPARRAEHTGVRVAAPKIMFIGASGSGKTTLYQRLFDLPLTYSKTQSLEFCGQIVDTPGEYLENRNFYSALVVTSMDADYVALVMDCTATQAVFPPGFTRMFTRPTFGIISKIDLLKAPEETAFAEDTLLLAGVEHLIKTSAVDATGLGELKSLLAR